MREIARRQGSGENAISHTFLLWVFRQWWPIVVPVGLLLAAIAAALVIFLHTPKYEATALLMIGDHSPFVAFSEGGTDRNSSQRYIQTQLELLRSPVVLEPVLGRPEIGSVSELLKEQDRVTYLRERLTIKQVGQSELYNVSFTSASPETAAKVANAVVAEYIDIQSSDELLRSQRVIEILEQERGRREIEVNRLRKYVVELAKQVTGTDPFGGNKVTDVDRAMSPVGALFQSMIDADLEEQMLKAKLQSFSDVPALMQQNMESTGLLDFEVESHPDVIQRQKAISEIDAQMERIKLSEIALKNAPQWETDPDYVALKSQRAELEKDLAETKAKARDLVLAQRNEKRNVENEQEREKTKRDLHALQARKELLAHKFEDHVKELQSGGAKSVELEFARAELEREEKVFELIASRKLALQTELRAPARFQIRRKADAPFLPLEAVPYKVLLLACCGAFVAPFGLATLREVMVRRVTDVDQLAQEARVRVLGEVASLPVRYVAVSPRQLSGRLRRDTYVFAESIDSLRTNLALAEGLSGHQVFVVTSAAAAEGKTSVAVSLSMSVANATDEPVLIIDADMRSPSVASMLKTRSQPGLFEVLSKKCGPDDAIQQIGGSNLFVIPGGRATKSTHRVVGVAEIKELLEQLRPRFSMIVIDTPPILGASETLMLAKAADSVLFCSLRNVSKAKQVRLAINRLEHANVNIAGAVLSGTPVKRYEDLYGYYASHTEVVE